MLNQLLIKLTSASRASIVVFCALFGASIQLGCATATVPGTTAIMRQSAEADAITALTHHQGAIIISRTTVDGCRIEEHREGMDASEMTVSTTIETCPERMRYLREGDLLLETPAGPVITGRERPPASHPREYLSQVSEQNYVTKTAEELSWHRNGKTGDAPGSWTGPAVILERENAVVAVRRESQGDRLVRLEWPEVGSRLTETVLTDPLEKIEAIEPDADQKELALTVRRDHSLDIAIANAEEPFMNWVPADPADEVKPRWSPVGYKLSYIVRNRGGDVLRTVHVPTAAMVLLDFPDSRVTDYTWLPDGDRLVVALNSVTRSDHVVEATYTGSSKKIVVEPRYDYDRQTERLPGTPAGSSLIMPESVRYGDPRPLVIWATGGSASGVGFNPHLIPLLDRRSLGLLVVNGAPADLDPSLWSAIEEMRWVSRDHVWLVGPLTRETGIPEWVQRTELGGRADTARWLEEQLPEGRGTQ